MLNLPDVYKLLEIWDRAQPQAVNFSGKYYKNKGILLFFRAKSCKIDGILLIFHTHFSGKNVLSLKVD